MATYEEDSNKFNSQLEDQRILDNQNYYQMLVGTQRHDSQLLSEFNNAARKTDECNEEEEEEEPPVRDWQGEIIEEIRRHTSASGIPNLFLSKTEIKKQKRGEESLKLCRRKVCRMIRYRMLLSCLDSSLDYNKCRCD